MVGSNRPISAVFATLLRVLLHTVLLNVCEPSAIQARNDKVMNTQPNVNRTERMDPIFHGSYPFGYNGILDRVVKGIESDDDSSPKRDGVDTKVLHNSMARLSCKRGC
ncbi:MAG: hypothetical protein J3Q66DRAFT_89632 [Benniella sp.]|nr:MAG: hypothetical protein J3Q66DRAFT_89632 [Benniella sp.]